LIDTAAIVVINNSATGQNIRTVTYPTGAFTELCLSHSSAAADTADPDRPDAPAQQT
jgi:hypothetical protein